MLLGVAFGIYITLFEIDGYNLSGVVEVSEEKRDLLRSSKDVQLQLNYPEDSGSYLEISELNLHLPLNSFEHRLLLVLTIITYSGVVFWGLFQLRFLIKSAIDGSPFTRDNVVRFNTFSVLMVSIPAIEFVFKLLVKNILTNRFEFIGLNILLDIDYESWLLMGIFFYVIGRILDQGIRLQEEQALTI
jgi:hypothetical protein